MKLRELLKVTSLDTLTIVKGVKDRVITEIEVMEYKNEYGIIEQWKYDSFIELYGDMKVISQHVENNTLIILPIPKLFAKTLSEVSIVPSFKPSLSLFKESLYYAEVIPNSPKSMPEKLLYLA